MNTIARVILVAALALGSGCAKPDWIQQTLVTVDVTGTWTGSMGKSATSAEAWLELVQQGSKVTGTFRQVGDFRFGSGRLGPVEGSVAGDVFTFRQTGGGSLAGEVTVSGDEMVGYVTVGSPLPISLQRVQSSAPPRSP